MKGLMAHPIYPLSPLSQGATSPSLFTILNYEKWVIPRITVKTGFKRIFPLPTFSSETSLLAAVPDKQRTLSTLKKWHCPKSWASQSRWIQRHWLTSFCSERKYWHSYLRSIIHSLTLSTSECPNLKRTWLLFSCLQFRFYVVALQIICNQNGFKPNGFVSHI